jgi:hypothetical protein
MRAWQAATYGREGGQMAAPTQSGGRAAYANGRCARTSGGSRMMFGLSPRRVAGARAAGKGALVQDGD